MQPDLARFRAVGGCAADTHAGRLGETSRPAWLVRDDQSVPANPQDLDALLVIGGLAALIFVVAGIAQAVTGFGLALAAMPLLVLFIDPEQAVMIAVAVGAVITAIAWRRERAHVDVASARRLTGFAMLGLPVGLLALTLLSERLLTGLVAVTVLTLVLAMRLRLSIPSGPTAVRVAGVASGALLTSTAINGPPLVLVLQAAGHPPRTFRATLQAVFCLQDLLALVAFAVLGSYDLVVAAGSLGGVVGVRVGWAIGERIFDRLRPETFQRGVTGLLVVSALVAGLDALL